MGRAALGLALDVLDRRAAGAARALAAARAAGGRGVARAGGGAGGGGGGAAQSVPRVVHRPPPRRAQPRADRRRRRLAVLRLHARGHRPGALAVGGRGRFPARLRRAARRPSALDPVRVPDDHRVLRLPLQLARPGAAAHLLEDGAGLPARAGRRRDVLRRVRHDGRVRPRGLRRGPHRHPARVRLHPARLPGLRLPRLRGTRQPGGARGAAVLSARAEPGHLRDSAEVHRRPLPDREPGRVARLRLQHGRAGRRGRARTRRATGPGHGTGPGTRRADLRPDPGRDRPGRLRHPEPPGPPHGPGGRP